MSGEQQRWSSVPGGSLSLVEEEGSGDSRSRLEGWGDSSAAGWSVCSAPLSVSEEELRSELSLMGFSSVPRHRLLQFKEDLEQLMRSRVPSDVSASSHPGKENIPASPEAGSDREQHCEQDSCSELSFKLANHGRRKVVPITRKVLRRKSDGRVQVCDESSLSLESESQEEEEESRLTSRASRSTSVDCAKSFIRLPPYSLLDQYRQHSDPVGRYQEYKQSWDTLQGALERSKKDLRWRVRERMMSAPPAPLPRALPTPNSYVIPTEKKRYGLRWAIRQDLVNGNIPRGGS